MAQRRRFLSLLGGGLTTALLVSGCLGNPPTRSRSSSAPAIPLNRNANLEVSTISLGFLPILEAAPLVIGV